MRGLSVCAGSAIQLDRTQHSRAELDLGIALSCGYFDQAHFNHDFRAFAGLSPSDYLRHRMSRTHVVVR